MAITRSQLARVLGGTLEEAGASLRRIEKRLQGSGLRLRRVSPQAYGIEADLTCLSERDRFRLSLVMIDEHGIPPHVAAVLLALVRGYGTQRWIEDNVEPDDNCLEVLRRVGLVGQHGHFIEIAPAVGYSLGLYGWDSPDEAPTRDELIGMLRRF